MFRWEGRSKIFTDELKMLIGKGENDKIISMVGVTRPEFLIDSTGTTLLHLAAKYDNKKIIDYLLTTVKCKVDAQNSSGQSPLIIATEYGNYQAAEVLLNANADPLLTDNAGICALEIVLTKSINFRVRADLFIKKVKERAQSNVSNLVQILSRIRFSTSSVIYLKDINITKMFWEEKRSSPYFVWTKIELNDSIYAAMAVADGPHFEFLLTHNDFYNDFKAKILQWLLDVVVKRKAFEKTQYSIYNRSRIVELFIILAKKIIKLNLLNTGMDELEILKQIFRKADKEIVQALFVSGFVEHAKNKIGYDLRLNCFVNRHQNVRESAHKMAGYDVNSRNLSGKTALHLAVGANSPEVVENLLYVGADPNVVDQKGRTPVFYLVYTNPNKLKATRDCLVFLLRSGADVQICDIDGKTFFEYTPLINPSSWILLEPVTSKLAILAVTGVTLNQLILDFVNSDRVWRKHYDNYLRELHDMNKKKIFRSLTMFTLISQKPIMIARFVSGQIEEINKILQDPDCACKENSYYYPMLLWNIKEALRISKLRGKAALVIEKNIDQLKGFSLVVDKIVGFLNYRDLSMFCVGEDVGGKEMLIIERIKKIKSEEVEVWV